MMNQLKFDTGFFMGPNEIFDDIDTKTHEKLVYLYLCRCANNAAAFPSYTTIAEKCSMSRRKAIDCIDWLIERKLLVKRVRRTEGLNESNVYEILRPSAQHAPRVVQDMHHGSAQDAPGVVHHMHQGGAQHAPYKELSINNYSYKENNSPESPSAIHDTPLLSDDSSKSNKGKRGTKTPKYNEDNIYYQMAIRFRKNVDDMCVREGIQNGTAKANMEKWADQFRLLVETDEQTDINQINEVMEWVVYDDFWNVNVRSAATFRAKYVQLVLVMKQKKKQKRSGSANKPSKPVIAVVPASPKGDPGQQVSEDEFEKMMRFAAEQQAKKTAGGVS
ncbi:MULTISPECIES: helix-turn-helix domain-containing protein [unclassified Paenibacillus]|uniref:helix-turn-helix domain-containing protein n=2 Tax=Paenibacillus TaxID=44249 RepID=UPI0009A571EA|nr:MULTISPECIES: helix-turn-helix domain-containing protein [unclassified Paenibacillus]SLJ98362.1 Helix-turn-helix domain-containing protein [Paenibacillus sp. RU5A]SOC66776.1 Helix-turn-helix domain-containing protein [Paenibacillus sp. RU26A]SOC70075.1 Helix-turn-helix domain-containing protein [Paenibacillus sp. RU5M]